MTLLIAYLLMAQTNAGIGAYVAVFFLWLIHLGVRS